MGLVMQELDCCLSLGQEHMVNEELGRHRGREGKSECVLCGAECESVVRECSAYSNIRHIFVEKLREPLGNRYADFDKLSSIEKTAFVLGSDMTLTIYLA